MGLTVRQRRFVESYNGNATEAAIRAGYSEKTARAIGAENLTKPDIQKAIQSREQERTDSMIADRQERQQFWTNVVRDEDAEMRDRLRASELLGKSEGDFLERVLDETPEPPNIQVIFVDAAKDRRPTEQLE